MEFVVEVDQFLMLFVNLIVMYAKGIIPINSSHYLSHLKLFFFTPSRILYQFIREGKEMETFFFTRGLYPVLKESDLLNYGW